MHDANYYQECFMDRSGCLAPALNDPARTDWADAPRRHAVRGRCFEYPLPLVESAHARPAGGASRTSLAMLARWLWLTTGLLRRKLEIDWNQSATALARSEPLYARGTPSGGGLYPVEVYVVAKGVSGLEDGVYQYAEGRSSMWRLRSGDFSRYLGRKLGQPIGKTGLHIVLAGRFWKSAFKYKAFAYQATTEDVGAMLATLLRLAADDDMRTEVAYDFPDRDVDALLGLDEKREVSLVVVTVGRRPTASAPTRAIDTDIDPLPPVGPYLERSRAVHVPAVLQLVHESTRSASGMQVNSALHRTPRAADVAPSAEARRVFLPPSRRPAPLTYSALTARRSAMGLQTSLKPLMPTDLSALIGSMFQPYTSDASGTDQPPGSVRLFVLVRNIEGLGAGIYAVDGKTRSLEHRASLCAPLQLQDLYYLENYNIDSAALVLFIVGRKRMARARWGQRGLRVCNAEAGLLAQRTYLECAQRGLACGAFLGFNAPLANDLLGLERVVESTLLCMLVSRPPESVARFVFNLD